MARQFVVQLDNRPGELAHLARVLASRGIDIVHVACVGAGPTSCTFLTTADPEATRDVLNGAGMPFMEGEMVLAEIEDRPGGLAELAERLATAGVNILAVLTVGRHDGRVEMALSVDDEQRALEALGHPVAVATGA